MTRFDAWEDNARPHATRAVTARAPVLVLPARGAPFANAARVILSGRYEILEEIGHGGMGVVYRARHLELESVVAVKVLTPTIARDPELVERFRREARVLARLDHRNIVRVQDFVREGDTYYLVMELLIGRSLRDHLAEHVRVTGRPLPLRTALRIGADVARALTYAHTHEPPIVHRDIKPSNVVIEKSSSRAVLTDFGIAKLVDEAHAGLTRSTGFVGTVRYSAPEQLRHDRDVDGRADLYALGMVLYEVYTGQHIYAGLTDQEVIGRVLYEPAEPAIGLERAQPAFARVLARAIARDRTRRHPTAEALLADLEDCARAIVGEESAESGDVLSELEAADDATVRSAPPIGWFGAGAESATVAVGTAAPSDRDDSSVERRAGPRTIGGSRSRSLAAARKWMAARWWAVAALVVAAAIAVPCVLDGVSWLGRTFPGFFLMENRVVPTASAYHWTGMQAGLPFHSTLVAMDGVPVVDANEVNVRAERSAPGTPVAYRVVKDGAERELTIPTMRFGPVDYFLTFGLLHLNGVVIVLMGCIVAMLSPHNRQARVFLWMCLLMGLYPLTGTDLYRAHRFTSLHFLTQCIAPAAFMHLALVFPVERRITGAARALVYGPYAFGLVLAALVLAGLRAEPVWLTPLHVSYAFTVVGLLFLVGSSLLAYVQNRRAVVRGRVQVVMIGVVAAFVLPVLGFFNNVFGGGDFPINLIALTPLLFFVAVSYAIVKHKLFDAQLIVRRGLAFAVLLIGFTGLHLALSSLVDAALDVEATRQSPTWLAGFAAFAVAISVPLRDRLGALIDARVFPHKRRLHETILDMSHAIGRLTDVKVMLDETLRALSSGMRITSGCVLLRDESGMVFVETATFGAAPAKYRLSANHPLAQFLATTRTELFIEDLEEDPQFAAVRDRSLRALAELRAELLLPLLGRSGMVGILALGRAPGSDTLTTEDLDVLRSLAAGVGLAVARRLDVYRAERMTLQRHALLRCLPSSSIEPLAGKRPFMAGTRRTHVASLCVRLKGLTAFADSAAPETTFDLLRDYYALCATVGRELGGMVERYEGSRVVLVFEADGMPLDATRHAMHAALSLRTRLEERRAAWRARDYELVFGCGVASGTAQIARTTLRGPRAIVAIGTPLDVAATLADDAPAGVILATRATAREAGQEIVVADVADRGGAAANVVSVMRVEREERAA